MKERKDCLFCKMASGDIRVKKIMETDNFFVVRDRFPQSEGHSLIISKKHYENLLHLPSLFGNELIILTKELYIRLSKEVNSGGFNIVQNNFKTAGQIIPHFHCHVIPRKQNDGVKLN